ncbi:28S ribosomal protein S26, mitochondrial isoform X1 [Hemicordylus capensis]|uniref:28S ribosomal protein S26, mitochondrial isoform X1 n=1 Tax=Hemicordylus capensis TaxID=884348 RepID=UPI00230399EF|nr:28S ribosomal protein S26, mitochondrial isoform X1 [Hemicordylus capensis]
MVLVSDRAVPRPLPAPLPGMLRGLVPLPSRAALLGQAPLLAAAPSRGRKSRTDPPAKSKAGRIKVPPPVDPAELLVVTQRYERYRLVVRALRAEFREEMLRQQYEEKFGGVGRQRKEAVAEEHRKLMAWNDAENKRLQELRKERLRKEAAEEEERRSKEAQYQAARMEEFLKEKEKEVLQLQEEAKTFITPENLEERIEECLNNPRNYNFAIDKEGRVASRSVLP